MLFRPKLDSTLTILGIHYSFLEHPNAKGMLYGQSGKRGTVYKIQDKTGKPYALKVFNQKFRSEDIESSALRLASYKDINGLEICQRTVITAARDKHLVEQYPDLEYAVLMPWVQGETWFDILKSNRPFSVDQSRFYAKALADLLSALCQRQLAHCDISGPNLLVDFPHNRLSLVDIEEMYGPGFTRPSILPSGTAGYGHKLAVNGLWSADADRFSGSILIAEILGKSEARFNSVVGEDADSYFDKEEIHSNSSDRYRLLKQILNENFGSQVCALLEQAWTSPTLNDCPQFHEWSQALTVGDVPRIVSTAAAQTSISSVTSRLYGASADERGISVPQVPVKTGLTSSQNIVAPPPTIPGGPVSAWRSLTPEKPSQQSPQEIDRPESARQQEPYRSSRNANIPTASKTSPTSKIAIGFAITGAIAVAVLLMLGSSVESLKDATADIGYVAYYGLGSTGLALILGLLQAWVFKDRLRSSKRFLYVLITALGGFAGGSVVGVISNVSLANGGGFLAGYLAGAIIGAVGGSVASVGQNVFLGNHSASMKWFWFNAISWMVIWSIGWFSTGIGGATGTALAAGIILILSGVTLQYLLKTSPEIEF